MKYPSWRASRLPIFCSLTVGAILMIIGGAALNRFPLLRYILLADNYSMHFHGRAVDQHGQSAAGVTVIYRFSQSQYGPLAMIPRFFASDPGPRVTIRTNVTDANGHFKVNEFGQMMTILWMGGSNYLWRPQEHLQFESGPRPLHTNFASAKIVSVWRKSPGYDLGSILVHARFNDFPGPHYINLQGGRVSTNDPKEFCLKVSFAQIDDHLNEFVISAPPDGVLYATNTLYPYSAPTETYLNQIRVLVPSAGTSNSSIFVKRGSQRLGIYAKFDPPAIHLDIATNIPAASAEGE